MQRNITNGIFNIYISSFVNNLAKNDLNRDEVSWCLCVADEVQFCLLLSRSGVEPDGAGLRPEP